MKTVVISGVSGQDGAYLSHFLLQNGVRVIGLTRSASSNNISKLTYLNIHKDVLIEECDLLDFSSIIRLLNKHKPDQFYNLAAQSSVALSFQQPIGTINYNVHSVLNILEAIRLFSPHTKFYQASSSEMFGWVNQLPIKEDSVLNPVSPYGISKATGHWIVKNYRESYGVFACSGILFNHESYLREDHFFVKKVILAALNIKNNKQKVLKVGNIDIRRDFGYATEYVKAMHLMLLKDRPDDFIICSGKSISLREIIEYVFSSIGISLDRIEIDKSLIRPTEIFDIYGSNAKAKSKLNWDYSLDFRKVLDILIAEELNAKN